MAELPPQVSNGATELAVWQSLVEGAGAGLRSVPGARLAGCQAPGTASEKRRNGGGVLGGGLTAALGGLCPQASGCAGRWGLLGALLACTRRELEVTPQGGAKSLECGREPEGVPPPPFPEGVYPAPRVDRLG